MSVLSFLESWLGQRARQTIRREKPLIVAVTGSVGKSSTKRTIAALLHADEPASRVGVSPKSYNTVLGLALSIFGLEAPGRSLRAWLRLLTTAFFASHGWKPTGMRTFVLEMGADHPGDIRQLVTLAPPDIAVVTAVTPEDTEMAPVHVANYPSIDALAAEKAELVRGVREGGTVVLNADDKRVFAMRHLTQAHVITFGEADGTDVQLVKIEPLVEPSPAGNVPQGIRVELQSLGRHRMLILPGVFGRSMAYALAASIGVAIALDTGREPVDEIPQHFYPLPGRVRILPGIKQTTLFDDSYNASPAAALSSIRDLASFPLLPHQRRVVCLGEMRELGKHAESLHRRVGAEVARQKIDLFVACGTLARVMAEGALANGMQEEQIKIFADTPEAGTFLQDWIRPGDVILAKASEGRHDSKGVRMERVIKELMAEPLRARELLVRQEEAWQRR